MQRAAHEDFELIPIVGQQLKFEIRRNAAHAPGFGRRFEAAHDEAADFFLEVNVAVRVAHHRKIGGDAVDALGHDVHMFGGMHRHGNAAQAPDLPGPLAGAIDDDLGLDRAPVRDDAGDRAIAGFDRGDARLLEDPRAAVARALGERLRQIGRVGLAVARQPGAAGEIVAAHDRPFRRALARAQQLAGDALSCRHRRHAAEYRHALRRPRHGEAAALLPARGKPGLGFEPRVQLGAVADQARHVRMRAKLADEARRVPRRAARKPTLFQHRDIAPAELGQMIGDRAPDDAAADDDDAGLGRERRVGHRSLSLCARRSAPAITRIRPAGIDT